MPLLPSLPRPRRVAGMVACGLVLALAMALAWWDASASTAASWKPIPAGTSFWLQLNGAPSLSAAASAAVIDIDGFDTPSSTIAKYKAVGKTVICYFSFGTWEKWRPDSGSFPASVKGGGVCANTDDSGKCTEYWSGELWLDTRSAIVRQLMTSRIKLGQKKGCDGVDPDNLDAYQANIQAKFTLTLADAINYSTWIASTAHSVGMSVGLKNAPEVAPSVVSLVDWALNEECFSYSDYSAEPWQPDKFQCDYLNAFIQAGKMGFVVEYTDSWTLPSSFMPKNFCSLSNAQGTTALLLYRGLQGAVEPTGDCLQHKAASCSAAATWKYCGQKTVYSSFKTDKAMKDVDMVGQCIRSLAASKCPYA